MQFEKLVVEDLWRNHFGLTKSISRSYHEATTVCLSRHHKSPNFCDVSCEDEKKRAVIKWRKPTQRMLAAWANDNDTTEAAAYGICLVAIEDALNLVAIARAETLTGADYYIAPLGTESEDLEDKLRLEISGINLCTESELKARLKRKQAQALDGRSNLPAMAAVIGFSIAKIMVAKVNLP